jgi:type IV secretion system protein VirB2
MKFTIQKENLSAFAWAIVAMYAMMLVPADALAAAGGAPDALSDVLCNVVEWFTGPIGAGIATLAIIVIGVGALMGKVSWGMAIIVGLGVGVIFGAKEIVDALSDGAGTASC